jgi:excinuclease ABC subunit A
LIWNGNSYFQGLNDFFKERRKNIKIQNRVMFATEVKPNVIPAKENVWAAYVKSIKNILVDFTYKHLVTFLKNIDLDVYENKLQTIISRNQTVVL